MYCFYRSCFFSLILSYSRSFLEVFRKGTANVGWAGPPGCRVGLYFAQRNGRRRGKRLAGCSRLFVRFAAGGDDRGGIAGQGWGLSVFDR